MHCYCDSFYLSYTRRRKTEPPSRLLPQRELFCRWDFALCASIGIWGILGLVWFGGVIVVRLRSTLRSSTDSEYHRVIGAISAAVLTTLVAGFVSEPTISSPDFYLLLAMLVAAASSSSKNSLLERKEAAAHLKVENYCFFLRNVPKQQY